MLPTSSLSVTFFFAFKAGYDIFVAIREKGKEIRKWQFYAAIVQAG